MIPTLYIGNLVKSRLKQLFLTFLAPHPRKKVFLLLDRDDRPHGVRAKRATKMLRPVPPMRQIFFALISTMPALPSFTPAPPAQRRSCCPAYGFNFFFLSLDGDGSSSHRCTPNASSSCLSSYLCLSCIFAIPLSLDGDGSPCHRCTPNTSPSRPSRPLYTPLFIFAPSLSLAPVLVLIAACRTLSSRLSERDRIAPQRAKLRQSRMLVLHFTFYMPRKNPFFCFKTVPFSSIENVSLGICNNFFGSDRTHKNFVLPVLARYWAAFQTWKSG